MTYIALITAAISLVLAIGAAKMAKDAGASQLALRAAQDDAAETKTTLADVLDGDGNVRGQLRLPGALTTDAASQQLEMSRTEVSAATRELHAAQLKLAELHEEKEGLERKLVELVDPAGKLLGKVRLPVVGGKRLNYTPCGMCKNRDKIVLETLEHGNASWDNHCAASGGHHCDKVRVTDPDAFGFVDAAGQCVHFKQQVKA